MDQRLTSQLKTDNGNNRKGTGGDAYLDSATVQEQVQYVWEQFAKEKDEHHIEESALLSENVSSNTEKTLGVDEKTMSNTNEERPVKKEVAAIQKELTALGEEIAQDGTCVQVDEQHRTLEEDRAGPNEGVSDTAPEEVTAEEAEASVVATQQPQCELSAPVADEKETYAAETRIFQGSEKKETAEKPNTQGETASSLQASGAVTEVSVGFKQEHVDEAGDDIEEEMATVEEKVPHCSECDLPLAPELKVGQDTDSAVVARMAQHVLRYLSALRSKYQASEAAQACLQRISEATRFFGKVVQVADATLEHFQASELGIKTENREPAVPRKRGRKSLAKRQRTAGGPRGRPRKPDHLLVRPRPREGSRPRGKPRSMPLLQEAGDHRHKRKAAVPRKSLPLKMVLKTGGLLPTASIKRETESDGEDEGEREGRDVKVEKREQEEQAEDEAPRVLSERHVYEPFIKRKRGRPRRGEVVVKQAKVTGKRGRPRKYPRPESPDRKTDLQRADEEQLALLESSRAREAPWACHLCHKEHLSEQSLLLHIRQVHGLLRNFRCQYCDKGFKRGYSRNAHERSLVCVRTERTYLKRELSRTHLCSACGNSFATSAALKAHFSTMHTTDAPFKCDICGKCFKLLGKLNQHIKFHSQDKPYMCELCSQSFKNKRYLQRHMNSGIHSVERNFACERCGRKFFLKKTLAQHMRIHADRKRYGCGLCDFRSNWRVYVTQHWRKCHPEAGEEPVVDLASGAKPLQYSLPPAAQDGEEQKEQELQQQQLQQQGLQQQELQLARGMELLASYTEQMQPLLKTEQHEPGLDLSYRHPANPLRPEDLRGEQLRGEPLRAEQLRGEQLRQHFEITNLPRMSFTEAAEAYAAAEAAPKVSQPPAGDVQWR